MGIKDISFASFNLLNLQLPGQPIYGDKDGWDQSVYDAKIRFTADMLTDLRADVVGFQELWAGAALDDVLRQADMAKDYVTLVPPDHRNNRITCAGIVRRGILVGEPDWIVEFPSELVLKSGGDDPQQDSVEVTLRTFSRPVLHFRVQPDPKTPVIDVFVCHFKSRRPAQIWRERGWFDKEVHGPHAAALGYAMSTIRRTAEATALRVIVTKIMKKTDQPVVVIGDMNDSKDSNTLNIMTEQPRYLSPLSLGGSDNALYTAQTMQEYRSVRDVYYTHIYEKQHESLDHILFSEQFYDNSKRRLWAFDEMIVNNDQLNSDDHKENGSNDHGVIRCSFKWKPERHALTS